MTDENDLSHVLVNTDWIVAKIRNSDTYAQNVYAAMCNMRWQRIDVMPILKDEYWSCTWRTAGGIVAGIRGSGDYMDFYCSGILDSEDIKAQTGIASEGMVTEEVAADFLRLGWQPSEWPADDTF